MEHLVWAIFLFTLGACIGSFLNVVIYRVPRNESVVFPPSHCPRCGKGKLFAGFLDLRPGCESCGLDYAFIDAGDGPAIVMVTQLSGPLIDCVIEHSPESAALVCSS